MTLAQETAYDTGLGGLAYAQRYGENAPAAGLEGTSIPKEYIRVNYTALFWLYVPFFIVPIFISWYYLVTITDLYTERPFACTALLVRLPLLLLGVYAGAVVYALAQGAIILAFVSGPRPTGGKGGGFLSFYEGKGSGRMVVPFLFVASVLNLVHFGLWMQHVNWRQSLFMFTPYMAEYAAETGGAVGAGWGSTLCMPLIAPFLMVEPVITGSTHILILAANLVAP